MSVVIAAVPMCITLSVVVAVTMLPMAIRKSCWLVTVLVIPPVIGMTMEWAMS